MDNNRFIDLETYEVKDNIPKYIIADKNIVNTIAILNKKGYITKASCGGHFVLHQKYLNSECDIKYLEDVKNDSNLIIENIRKDDFDYWDEWKYCDIYVMFNGCYGFSFLPDGFIIENNNTIRHYINYFDKNKKRRKNKEILNEIEKYNKILEEWANNLPDIN